MTKELPEFSAQGNAKRDVLLFSGYAKLPSGTASSEVYGVMALVLLLDVHKGTIIEADCTLSTRLAERFVASLLVGKSIKYELQEMVELIDDVYQGSAKKSIICALRIIYDKYVAFVREHQGKGEHSLGEIQ